jgi:GT2 family glycosyltransferase
LISIVRQSSAAPARLTIVIKALNEERRIAACLQAAVREAQAVGGEVLLVDSLSTDRTVEMARRYPVRIVQFDHIADRGCGAAVQLGFQYVRTPFLYVLDADMVLQPGFLAEALACLERDPRLAGVGGKLCDTRVRTAYDTRRVAEAAQLIEAMQVGELGGGGLYRFSAIESVGYLANRWLAAYEEADLGMRLHAAGWRLVRIPTVAVVHEGHNETNWAMLRRLWRNGRAQAGGALLRSALGRPWFARAARKQAYVLAVPLLHGMAGLAAAAGQAYALPAAALYGAVCASFVALLAVRNRGLQAGWWSALTWHFFAAAALQGFVRAIPDPRQPIPGTELTGDGNDHSGPPPCRCATPSQRPAAARPGTFSTSEGI